MAGIDELQKKKIIIDALDVYLASLKKENKQNKDPKVKNYIKTVKKIRDDNFRVYCYYDDELD